MGPQVPPGTVARYSNVGYLGAGAVIESAAGMPFEECVHDLVLRPLGMDATGFTYGHGAQRATGYVQAPPFVDPVLRRLLPTGIVGDRHGPYLALNPFYVDGPSYGGLVGPTLDAARFVRMHLRDGELDGSRILAADTARRMRVDRAPRQACRPRDRLVPTAAEAHRRAGSSTSELALGSGT